MLEATDRAGARQLAERIRQEVEQQTFPSSQGRLQGTLSIGVASYPDDAREKAELIARADQCPLRRQARRPQPHRLLRRHRPQAEGRGREVAACVVACLRARVRRRRARDGRVRGEAASAPRHGCLARDSAPHVDCRRRPQPPDDGGRSGEEGWEASRSSPDSSGRWPRPAGRSRQPKESGVDERVRD